MSSFIFLHLKKMIMLFGVLSLTLYFLIWKKNTSGTNAVVKAGAKALYCAMLSICRRVCGNT